MIDETICKNTLNITQEAVPELRERMTPPADASWQMFVFRPRYQDIKSQDGP